MSTGYSRRPEWTPDCCWLTRMGRFLRIQGPHLSLDTKFHHFQWNLSRIVQIVQPHSQKHCYAILLRLQWCQATRLDSLLYFIFFSYDDDAFMLREIFYRGIDKCAFLGRFAPLMATICTYIVLSCSSPLLYANLFKWNLWKFSLGTAFAWRKSRQALLGALASQDVISNLTMEPEFGFDIFL